MFYFYILRCADGTLYSGQTSNLRRRLHEHNFDGKRSAKYLRGKTPVTLVYSETCETLHDALAREREVKKWKKSKKEALVGASPI